MTIKNDKEAQYVRAKVTIGMDPATAAAEAAVKYMNPAERERRMRDGELSLTQLAWMSRNCPDEVPKIKGEFAWIVMSTPEYCERRG